MGKQLKLARFVVRELVPRAQFARKRCSNGKCAGQVQQAALIARELRMKNSQKLRRVKYVVPGLVQRDQSAKRSWRHAPCVAQEATMARTAVETLKDRHRKFPSSFTLTPH